MKNPCKNCRRTFIKNSLAVTAGITFLGKGIKVLAQDEDPFRWVAFCCNHCDTCGLYPSGCWSCKSTQGLLGSCGKKRCAIDIKNVPTCAHCDDFDTCEEYPQGSESRQNVEDFRATLTSTGIEKNADFKVFPNPATKSIKIINPNKITSSYKLVTTQGKIVKKGLIETSEYLLDISDIQSGTYILRLEKGKTTVLSRKIVKK